MLKPKKLKNFENTNKSIPTLPEGLSSITQLYFQDVPKLYFWLMKQLDNNIPFNQCSPVPAQKQNLKYFCHSMRTQYFPDLKFTQKGPHLDRSDCLGSTTYRDIS